MDDVVTVAVSGADNTGKTKQLGILARRLGALAVHAGPLDAHDDRWERIKTQGMGTWWWHDAPVQEVADVLASSYLARSRHAATLPGVRLVDRGLPMLEASLAATVAVREQLDPNRAAHRARQLLTPFAAELEAAEAGERGVLLLHDEDPEVGTRLSLSHEASITDTYAAYQRHLHHQIHRLADAGRFAEVIVVAGRPVVAVQDELRRRLHPHAPAIPTGCLPGLGVVALGGLSESGKSTMGEYLRTRHGHDRLKIGYLIEQAAAHAGITDPYALPPVVRAELLLDGLDRYAAAHHYLTRLTIESLHEYDVTAELRRMLGGQLTVAYVEATAGVRKRRGTAGAADVEVRDEVKQSRGAGRIGEIADLIVSNNGTRLALERQLDRLALDAAWPAVAPATAPVNTLGLPLALEVFLTALLERTTGGARPVIDLLAVTGSGARGKYQQGWSDLDVFVIAEPDRTQDLRAALAEVQQTLGAVKLGITVLSRAECFAGTVTSRLLHVLTLLGSGALLPQWVRAGLVIPAPPLADDVTASVKAAVQAAVEIRRQLLKPAPDLRALYKITALLAKILARFDGVERAGDEEALSDLVARVGARPELVAAARDDQAAARELAALVLAQWTATLPPATAVAA
ncbi:nucleotidyltransferase domain-containing protein [Kitasatospora sp. NPDC051853]|uniref:nucleotidyltransferase domain-containing protein n=1 Tax=Kitasatospora sp. NPDC051853 TaxID=3364058 RepID=UPI00379BF088